MDHIMEIGGIPVTQLKDTYRTPLYVMDEMKIRSNCQMIKKSLSHPSIDTEVIYASKAFLSLAMCQLIHEEGLSMDVVSGGELFTAYKAGFPMDKIFFHGNNKSIEEIQLALRYQVGYIVIDHENELDRLLSIVEDHQRIKVLLRVNPGIEAHTHDYIKTTQNTSKFGVSTFDLDTLTLIKKMASQKAIQFMGIHTHIGSQIFEEKAFLDTATELLNYILKIKNELDIDVQMMNLGGGFGVKYTEDDQPIDLNCFLPKLLNHIQILSKSLEITPPKVLIEPGRSIVAEAGYTLYTISGTKQTYGGKNYVFVDGSMADHMRTALYQAKYHAVIGNRLQTPLTKTYTVTGKACESGDMIIKDIKLPIPKEGDLLVVFTTGAYHYSMSSNYNRLLKPAVVMVSQGRSKIIVKRETYEDLIRNDCEIG